VLLAQVNGVDNGHFGILIMLGGLVLHLVFMIKVVQPIFIRFVLPRAVNGKGETALAAACACAIGSGLVTQAIGLHYIFGAFLAGVIMPRELKQSILARLETATVSVLMPFFFAITGLRTLIDFSSPLFAEVLLITLVLSIVGKVGGTAISSVMTGAAWSSALCLGLLMQTKGLMEIVVLTVLLEKGIISQAAFSALTVMAIISTVIVMPLARLLLPSIKGRIALRAAE
jgi:Kef-type K+ transport system membrane component KefB